MIIFRTLKWKNFLSTGNFFTEINLDSNNTTLIVGSNGSGKSTMLDALCFVLFGKSFRNINKGQLVNTINQKDCTVEIEFDAGNKSYKIIRSIKPNLFEIYCNGHLVNQDAAVKDYQEHLEKFILKLNYKSFTQIVVLGSASFTPFMQLSASDRRSIIEDLLDIQIFSRMNSVLKDKFLLLKEKHSQSKYAVDLKSEKIQYQIQFIDSLNKNNATQILSKQQDIANTQSLIAESETRCTALQTTLSEICTQISDKSKVDAKLSKFKTLQLSLIKTHKKIDTDIEFYHNNDDCPTCKQAIGNEYKLHIVEERNKKLVEVDDALSKVKTELDVVNTRLSEIETIAEQIQTLNSQLTFEQSEIRVNKRHVDNINKEIERLNSVKDDVTAEQEKLATLNAELAELESEIKVIAEERLYYEVATNLLKDTGIKTKIIRQYIPVINKLVNKYLASLDFFVNFNLDESFKETIKSRHRDDFTYASFSEGEKQRIDMALMLTWRAVAKLKNSASTNILILDEIFDSSLDTNGTEDLMKILNMLEGSNLFVISHKGDILQDKFANVIRFEKVNNFSRIAK
jgi:DNA repair exonuclease SbcCD ATPase subunit